MKPPIILNDGGDLIFFASVEDVEQCLEVIDVERGAHIAYDSEGRLVKVGVAKQRGMFSGTKRVVVQDAESEPTHAAELRDTLVDFFSRAGESQEWLASASLGDLVRRGLERHRMR